MCLCPTCLDYTSILTSAKIADNLAEISTVNKPTGSDLIHSLEALLTIQINI